MKCVVRTCYGADRSTLLLMYRALIRSRLDYGCFIYDNTSDPIKRTLDVVHHSAIRIAMGAFRTTPVASLLAEAHEPPLGLRRQALGMRYALKLRQFPSYPSYDAVYSSSHRSFFGTQSSRDVSNLLHSASAGGRCSQRVASDLERSCAWTLMCSQPLPGSW